MVNNSAYPCFGHLSFICSFEYLVDNPLRHDRKSGYGVGGWEEERQERIRVHDFKGRHE